MCLGGATAEHTIMETILSQIDKFSTAEINELHLSLIRKASVGCNTNTSLSIFCYTIFQVPFLKTLYKEIGQLLSFDIVSQLPAELSEEVFSYLDENSLCAAAQCSKEWRIIANNDKIWLARGVKINDHG